jgi:hypothetical protein
VKIEIAFSLSSTSWFDVCPCGLNQWAKNKPPSSRQDDLKMIEKSSCDGFIGLQLAIGLGISD